MCNNNAIEYLLHLHTLTESLIYNINTYLLNTYNTYESHMFVSKKRNRKRKKE